MALNTKTAAPKGRILTPTELELADGLQKALISKATAEVMLKESRKEIGRLTGEIGGLKLLRSNMVWAQVRENVGAPSAPTREDLMRR